MASKNDIYQTLNPGDYFHIYNRGNNKETIFKTHENYIYFLELWKKYIYPIADTFCYNLLPNHFHFFIRIREIPLSFFATDSLQGLAGFRNLLSPRDPSRHFSNLFNAYAKSINKKFERTGSLFQERFRRKKITSASYYTSIIGYILTNAIKHGYSRKAHDYAFSAYSSILSTSQTLLLRNEVLEWFGGKAPFI